MNKKNILIISLLMYIIIFFVLSTLFDTSFVYWDDLNIKSGIKNIILKPLCGIPLSSFFNSLFALYFPKLLHIHPSDFRCEYFKFIEPIFIIYFIFILNKLIYLKNKITILYPITFLFNLSIVFSIIQKQPMILYIYDGFFRMLMPVFILITLIYIILNKKESITFFDNIYIIIFTFLCCISNEFICVTTIVGMLLYSVLSVIHKKSDIKNLVLYTTVILFATLILVKTGAFTRKSTEEIYHFSHYINTLKLLSDFIFQYIKYVILNHIPAFIFLISQMIILNNKIPNNTDKKETINIILCFLTGIFIFFFLLIFLGKNYYIPNNYWLIHPDLHVMYSIILLSFNLILFGFILNYTKIQHKILICILVLYIIPISIKNMYFYTEIKRYTISYYRLHTYKIEKIMRFANIKKIPVAIPEEITRYGDSTFWYDKKDNTVYSTCPYIDYHNKFPNSKIDIKFVIKDAKTVDAQNKKLGITYTDEELRDIKFGRLLDNNFLLKDNS